MNNNDEASLKEIILTISDYVIELKKYFIVLLSVLIISSLAGYFYAKSTETQYEALLSFIVNENNATQSSAVSGLATQFGFNLAGGSTSSLNQYNIIEILKSEKIISSTLNRRDSISGKHDLLLNHFIRINNLPQDNLVDTEEVRSKDSILNIVSNMIYHQLDVSFQNESGVLNLRHVSKNPDFAISFVELLIEEMIQMYSSWQTEKPRDHFRYITHDVDSIKKELWKAQEDYAREKDQNIRVTTNSGKLNEIRCLLKMEDLSRTYKMLLEEERVAKRTLLYEKPIIRIIDRPRHPLKKIERSRLLWTTAFSLVGLIFVSFIIILRKIIRDSLLGEN